MAGHSKWAQIKRSKGINDQKRSALFTRIGNQIAVAARSGTDPETNFALRMVIDTAKAANMPMSNIDRAIQRANDKSLSAMEEVTYEGYGPGGVAIIVECATDNRNRTYPEVKNAFNKHGGSIAEPGSVSFQFERKGLIRVKGTGDDLTMIALDAGAEDIDDADDELLIYTDPKLLASTAKNLIKSKQKIIESSLVYRPKNLMKVIDETTESKIFRLMEALEDLDDTTNTYTNVG